MPYPLKYFFIENGRSGAFTANLYVRGHYNGKQPLFKLYPETSPDSKFNPLILQSKAYFNAIKSYVKDTFPDFQFVGIDFEWPSDFYDAVSCILSKNGTYSNKFLNTIRDSSYVNRYKTKKSINKFIRLYRGLQKQFIKDSSNVNTSLNDTEKFEQLKYILSNHQYRGPYKNRNKGMAANLLNEIQPLDTNFISMLEIGMAHSMPNKKGTLADLLANSNLLKGKILVVNLFCDNCRPNVGASSNWALDFMSDSTVYHAFKSATQDKGEITLFDLSDLPSKYAYIKAYGDLLIYAKNQH